MQPPGLGDGHVADDGHLAKIPWWTDVGQFPAICSDNDAIGIPKSKNGGLACVCLESEKDGSCKSDQAHLKPPPR